MRNRNTTGFYVKKHQKAFTRRNQEDSLTHGARRQTEKAAFRPKGKDGGKSGQIGKKRMLGEKKNGALVSCN